MLLIHFQHNFCDVKNLRIEMSLDSLKLHKYTQHACFFLNLIYYLIEKKKTTVKVNVIPVKIVVLRKKY